MEIEMIKKAICACKKELRRQFGIISISVFGSYARGEQTPASDLDLAAEFESVPTILQLMRAEWFLSERLGMHVDLVYKAGLKPRVRRTLLAQQVIV